MSMRLIRASAPAVFLILNGAVVGCAAVDNPAPAVESNLVAFVLEFFRHAIAAFAV